MNEIWVYVLRAKCLCIHTFISCRIINNVKTKQEMPNFDTKCVRSPHANILLRCLLCVTVSYYPSLSKYRLLLVLLLCYRDLQSALDIVASFWNRLSVFTRVVCPCRPRGSAVRNQVPPLACRQGEGPVETFPSWRFTSLGPAARVDWPSVAS